MKLLKLSVEGLPQFEKGLEVEFVAQQRVDDVDREMLYCVFSNIYVNQALSFIGINASGKTTVLKAISFVMDLLNNEPLNSIPTKEILHDLEFEDKVIFRSYFYHDQTVYKLKTAVEKTPVSLDGDIKYVIADEMLWKKEIRKIKTKKSLYDFKDTELERVRDLNEQYLMEDVSIMVALNKTQGSNFVVCDMSDFTDHNLLNALGRYPREILAFLDPSIEYLSCKPNEKDVDICLKFYGKEETNLTSLLALNSYLSSGTIKGLGIFMRALMVFQEGGYLIVDELENHFNREIVSTLIRFFMDKKVNKNGGTLIFSTHYSELLDEFERNDSIYIVRNKEGITAENLSKILKRNDMKKSEVYDSDFLKGTVPAYDSYIALKKALMALK